MQANLASPKSVLFFLQKKGDRIFRIKKENVVLLK